MTTATLRSVDDVLATWPEKPSEAARTIIERYGEPHEATESRLIWHNVGPWKRTIVYRDEHKHDFPKPHTDVLEQFIDYRIRPERLSELARFDGSIVAYRTNGELSARCDQEAANFLALNLADEIVTGGTSVDEARQKYTEQIVAMMMGKDAPYTERFLFQVPSGGTADPDEQTLTDTAKKKIKEKLGVG